jgi:DNA-binding NarL/FixJ family response regulator
MRVVLAEDNLLVREGVRRLLESQAGIDLAAVCADVDTLRDAVAPTRRAFAPVLADTPGAAQR